MDAAGRTCMLEAQTSRLYSEVAYFSLTSCQVSPYTKTIAGPCAKAGRIYIRLPFCPVPPWCSNQHLQPPNLETQREKVPAAAAGSGLPASHAHLQHPTVAARKLSISSIGRGDKLRLSSLAALCRLGDALCGLRASERQRNPLLKNSVLTARWRSGKQHV